LTNSYICPFHTGLNKRGSRKSCAISLFTEDTRQTKKNCQTAFLQWIGPEVAYLGKNRWAFLVSVSLVALVSVLLFPRINSFPLNVTSSSLIFPVVKAEFFWSFLELVLSCLRLDFHMLCALT
jgi:hypothetical protein